ncbi:hypothetical protein OOK29_09840 [Streptomyces phaeochromogenes]|uniref:hypothetical protein n=1 Tax=Streptomyces phaeochromogenes TaxID=1923 RepID=UPI0022556D1F|nr:hypothetical protein [Streptomyces phaeochromogenes]MCX5598439.1 hypothetical protein [Streptomyces phaeochromogenes]
MARYFITFDNGMKAPVVATEVEQNVDGSEYRFLDENGRIVAYIPVINVVSVILDEEPPAVTD